MDIFTELNIYRNAIRHINFYFSEEKKENALPGKMMGEIIRNVHSIEKGLSLEKPRKFFGYKKIMDMFELLDSYVKCDFYEEEVVYMALDAVKEYLEIPRLGGDMHKHASLKEPLATNVSSDTDHL